MLTGPGREFDWTMGKGAWDSWCRDNGMRRGGAAFPLSFRMRREPYAMIICNHKLRASFMHVFCARAWQRGKTQLFILLPPVITLQIFLLSYAQCKSACRCFLRQSRCPSGQFFLSWALCRVIAFHLLICLLSSEHLLPM